MNLLRFTVRLLACIAWVLFGLLTIVLCYPWAGSAFRGWSKRWWSASLLVLCGVRTSVEGEPRLEGPVLWVANHISWIDIFALNRVRPTAFVAKSEIRSWPLLGWLVAGAGTIFIERASRHAVHRVGQSMRAQFTKGRVVGLFPEGTTSPGFDVLPFYANLFEPARQGGAAIQPVALRYFHGDGRSDFAAYVGEETLVQNLWRVLGGSGVRIEIVFLPPVWSGQGEAPVRAVLGRLSHEAIRRALK